MKLSETGVRLKIYAGLSLKVVWFSLPILALLSALHIAPVVVENIAEGRNPISMIGPVTLVSLKLWLLFVGVLAMSTVLVACFLNSRQASQKP